MTNITICYLDAKLAVKKTVFKKKHVLINTGAVRKMLKIRDSRKVEVGIAIIIIAPFDKHYISVVCRQMKYVSP